MAKLETNEGLTNNQTHRVDTGLTTHCINNLQTCIYKECHDDEADTKRHALPAVG